MSHLRALALAVSGLAIVSMASFAWAEEPAPDPDLVKLGRSLLPDDEPVPARRVGRSDAAAPNADLVGAATDAAAPDADLVGAAIDASAEPDAAADASVSATPSEIRTGDPGSAPTTDGAPKPKPQAKATEGTSPARLGPGARQARIDSGQNLPLQGAAESPLAALGVPAQAVPAVATTATVGAMAVWPFVLKTLTGLLKSVFGAFLKSRAKKGKTIDKSEKAIDLMGFVLRPAELAALLVGATVYGLAICYAFKGRNISASFFATQEALVVGIYYARSFVRFAYERAFKLPTRFRFWMGGGLLCLGSAYLGNPLGTVGYELEETTSPEDAKRIVKMKAWLIALALGMALAFFAANILHPNRVLQAGRVMMSGMMLAEILPITPMPGLKIYRWNKSIWALLAVVIVPTFVLINFVL